MKGMDIQLKKNPSESYFSQAFFKLLPSLVEIGRVVIRNENVKSLQMDEKNQSY